MAIWYVLYSKVGCNMCIKTKELLQVMGMDYYEVVLPENDEWNTPVVFREEDFIGGYYSLRNHLYRKRNNGKKKKTKGTERFNFLHSGTSARPS